MEKLVVIDGSFWLFSCYYATAAMGNLMVNKDGVPTNAVYGFANRLESLLKQNPEYIVVAFDAKGKTFRSELLEEYKGTRKPTPDELVCQFSMIREYLEAHHIPYIEKEGYEGDDIIGTISKKASSQGMEVAVYTNDKDMMQLIDSNVKQYKKPQKTNDYEVITVESFKEKYNLEPDQMRDLLGLMGDSADNIPGIPGIGEKTALKLLNQYGTIENLKEHMDELKGKMNNSFMRIKYNDKDLLQLEEINIHYGRRYCKRGNTNLLSGFTSEFLEELDNIGGIESISYSAYESERKWFWDNQDYHKMGLDMISPDMSNSRDTPITDYGYRYIFSTEYVNPTKELYKKLEKYIDKEYRNYDDFVNGRQVVVFLQDAPDGSYDDTLKAGDTLNYNYYELPVDASFHVPMNIAGGRYVYPYDKAFFDKYNNSGKIDLHAHYYVSGGNMIGGTGTENPVREQVIDGYEVLFGACVSPTVAAVIKVTDDIREDFNGIMVDYGYYTALAGMSLAEQAVDNQRNLMERMTGDEMTGDLDFSLHYNQLSVQYDLSSAFSATNNKLSVYFENNDLAYGSNVDAKNIYRTQLINNILQYGITIAAAVVIQLLIMAIIVRNRIERRKEKYKLLHGLGMRRGTIVKICMLEALRESVWCIFTMPLILIMELLMYTRKNLVE